MRRSIRPVLWLSAFAAVFLVMGPLWAYDDDVHYALTYYIARQVGYTPEQAYRIASATVSVDWSAPTEAVQAGISAIYQLPSAQEPRWRYHAMRNEILYSDVVGGERNSAKADVMSRGQQTALWNQAIDLRNPGVFLHYFQDIVPHGQYGTKAGHWPVLNEEDLQLHQRNGLPVGGTTDWLSYRSVESNLTMVEQTAGALASFMSRVSPKQQPRPLNVATCLALINALRKANPFPEPLQGKSIDVLRRAQGASAASVMELEAALGFIANQSDLSPQESANISRHLRSSLVPPAIEKVNEAMAKEGMRAEPEMPFETLNAKHRQYQFDDLGFLVPKTQSPDWVLVGSPRVKVKVNGSDGQAPKQLKVVLRMAKTRPSDIEYTLADAMVTPDGEPAVFEAMPIGELIFDVFDDVGVRLLSEKHTLEKEQQTFILNVRLATDLVMRGHAGWVVSVAFAPDGSTVASSGEDKTIRFWDLATGTLKRTITHPSHSINAIAYSPDGESVAGATSQLGQPGAVQVWNAITGRLTANYTGHDTGVAAVAYAPDGQTLASGDYRGTIMLWTTRTGEIRARLNRHVSSVTSLAFSPDGRWLVSGSDDRAAIIWNVTTGEPRYVLREHDGKVLSVAFSRDGRWVATGTQHTSGNAYGGTVSIMGTVKIWDAATGSLKTTLPQHGHGVFALGFSPTADVLACRSSAGYTADLSRVEDNILFWDSETGRLIDKLTINNDQTMAVAFSRDGRTLAAGGVDRAVRVWTLDRILAKRVSTAPGGSSAAIPVVRNPVVLPNTPAPAGERDPRPGELDLTGGRFAPDQWDLSGNAGIDNGALRIDIPAGGQPTVRAASRQRVSGDFDMRVSYSLDQYDPGGGFIFQLSVVSRPGNAVLLDPSQIAALPSVKIARASMQGGDFCFSAAGESDGQAVMAGGRGGTLRVERRGDDWTFSQLDASTNSWTLVGKLSRSLGKDVGIDLMAARNGSSALKITVGSIVLRPIDTR